jgi:hypothetical protein
MTRMADPLSLAVTIVTLVTKAFAISIEIHIPVEQTAKGLTLIKELADDLEDFHSRLGCLKGHIEDAEIRLDIYK